MVGSNGRRSPKGEEEGDAVRNVKLVAALCLATTVAACASQQSGRPPLTASPTSISSGTPSAQSDEIMLFGHTHTWDGGLSVTISAPRSLTPSDMAFPQSPRVAVFELTIDNRTTESYRPALLNVKATTGDRVLDEVVDPAQGLNGIIS